MEQSNEMCQTCKKNEGTLELHSCPYQAELYDDEEEKCNCCEECVHECAMDV